MSSRNPLPLNYKIPAIGEDDHVGGNRGPETQCCGFEFNEDPRYTRLQWVCTLPAGHWGGFHVAHVGTRVVGVYLDPTPTWLRLQEGL